MNDLVSSAVMDDDAWYSSIAFLPYVMWKILKMKNSLVSELVCAELELSVSGLRRFLRFGEKVHIKRTKRKASKTALKSGFLDGEVGM